MTADSSRREEPRFVPTGRARIASFLALLIAIPFVSLTPAALAQNGARTATKFYPDFSDTADALLRNAAGHARDGQWAEAIEIYQRVIQQYGDKVARLPKDDPSADPTGESSLYVDIRQFCQRKLAALPPEARALYRTKVDAQAERWFRQGEANRDRAPLRRVLDQAFASAWGDEAADLLGDLAFLDGEFDEALESYRLLVPDTAMKDQAFVHPDPSVDLARVAAKKLLCREALGETDQRKAGLAEFSRDYPDAKGLLAGREGKYLDTLTSAFENDHLAGSASSDGRWPTFAGSPSRTRVVPGPVDVGSLQWKVDLDPVKLGNVPRYRGVNVNTTPGRPDKLLAYHPIVVGDQVIVCDDGHIVAYNLNDRPDGQAGSAPSSVNLAWKHDEEQGGGMPQVTRFTVGIPRYTLTAHGDRIFARMGMTTIPQMGRMGGMGGGTQSYLVAVDRSTDGKLLWKKPPGDVITSRKPGEPTTRNLGFEGSPVANDRHVYVAMTDRREQTATYVVCLDADTGSTRWVRYLGAASVEGENVIAMGMGMGGFGSSDYGHRLLTLEGPTVYYQTNLGAVVALDCETGLIRWVATYPRVDRGPGAGHDRDLNPAVVHGGLVIVAPDDANAIFAFDTVTGRLVWRTDPIPDEVKLAHLLGVAKGRLIATGDRVLLFDVKNGKLVHSWPEGGHGYDGYGRGLLAGDKIYWPTRGEIHVLFQDSGLRSDPPIGLQQTFQETGGNLAVGDGYLIVAQDRKLVVFCQNRRLMQRYRDEIARAPDDPVPHFRLARAAEATGDGDEALENFAAAARLAKPSDSIDGTPLLESARDGRFKLLMKLGDKERTGKAFAKAEARYHEAAASARLDRDRLRASLAEADSQDQQGQPSSAINTLQRVLSDDRLRGLTVSEDDGRRTIRADILIADRLGSIVRDRGREIYADYDRQARALLDRGKAADDSRLLEEVGRSFPVAEVVPEAWLALGRQQEKGKQPGDAVGAYKRLLAASANESYRARALIGLGRAYEAQKLWVPARDAYSQALARYPRVMIEAEDGVQEAPLGSLVSTRLTQPPFDRMTADRAEPSVPAPLERRLTRSIEGKSRPITAEGVPPSGDAGRIFLAVGTEIRPTGLAEDRTWSADLGGTPVWVGYLDDRILAATEDRLIALSLDGGKPLWRFETGAPGAAKRPANPFDRPTQQGAVKTVEAPGKLRGFKVLGDRVYLLRAAKDRPPLDGASAQGVHELLALDGETGLPDWTFADPAGEINPNLLVSPERVLLQVRKPGSAVVLETATGRRRAEFLTGKDEDWARPPLALDDDHAVLVTDRRTVVLFDMKKGETVWSFRESRDMPKNGPPRVIGDAGRLFLVHDGNELIRLDPTTGQKTWSRPLGVENLSDRVDSVAVDDRRVYWVNKRTLSAASIKDGALEWSRFLSGPESGWAVELTERCVLAYPGPSRGGDAEPLPLVFRRRNDGALVQRLLFSAPATELAVRLVPGGVLVATPSEVWTLGERTPMDARRGGR